MDILIDHFLFGRISSPIHVQTGLVGIRGLEEVIVSHESYVQMLKAKGGQ